MIDVKRPVREVITALYAEGAWRTLQGTTGTSW
jgi:hypothetical protein